MLERIIQFHRVSQPVRDLTVSKHIWISTRRYSALLKRIFVEYHENAEICIEGHRYTEADIPKLLKGWCTNRNIRKTSDFYLQSNGVTLFGFHDTPNDFWAALSERPFIERLASEKIVRYRIVPTKTKSRTRGALELLLRPFVWILGIAIIVFAGPVLAARWCYRRLKGKSV